MASRSPDSRANLTRSVSSPGSPVALALSGMNISLPGAAGNTTIDEPDVQGGEAVACQPGCASSPVLRYASQTTGENAHRHLGRGTGVAAGAQTAAFGVAFERRLRNRVADQIGGYARGYHECFASLTAWQIPLRAPQVGRPGPYFMHRRVWGKRPHCRCGGACSGLLGVHVDCDDQQLAATASGPPLGVASRWLRQPRSARKDSAPARKTGQSMMLDLPSAAVTVQPYPESCHFGSEGRRSSLTGPSALPPATAAL